MNARYRYSLMQMNASSLTFRLNGLSVVKATIEKQVVRCYSSLSRHLHVSGIFMPHKTFMNTAKDLRWMKVKKKAVGDSIKRIKCHFECYFRVSVCPSHFYQFSHHHQNAICSESGEKNYNKRSRSVKKLNSIQLASCRDKMFKKECNLH